MIFKAVSRKALDMEDNEDHFVIDNLEYNNTEVEGDTNFGFYAVFTGKGSKETGIMASNAAAKEVAKVALLNKQARIDSILNICDGANKAVIGIAIGNALYNDVTAAMAGLMILYDKFIWFNVGESRVYRLRAHFLRRFSNPVPNAENRRLTRDNFYLGNKELTKTSINIGEVEYGVADKDVFFLATEGVFNAINEDMVWRILDTKPNIEEASIALVSEIESKKPKTSYTFIIVKI